MEALKETNAYGGFARQVLKQKWVKPNKRIFDNTKISDHFAIIPTLVQPKHLNEIEAKLYDFVVRRFIAAFYPPAEFTLTTRITRVAGEPFKSEGKVMVAPGWLAVYGKEAQVDEGTLTPVKPGEIVATEKIEVAANQTRPPARFNEATLLSAMEGAGKLIDDEELREAMREKGLGTPATRAQVIEGLLTEKYILREGKELQPTAKAFSLIALLRGLGVPELFSPEMTAEWEFKLAQMEHGALAREDFMREIVAMTEHIVGQAKEYESDTIPGDFATLGVPCPKCGGEVHENYKKFQCQACEFGFWKIMGGRQLEAAEAETLLRERKVGPLDGFRSRLGRPFSASIKLNDANEVSFDFPERDGDDGEVPDFTGQEPLGACPKCALARVRVRAGLRLREGGGPRQDLRLPLRPRDPAAAGRAGADAEAAGHRQDRSAGVRLRAHEARVLRVPRAPARRQDRLRVRGEGRRQGQGRARARGGRRCACSARIRRTSGRWNCTPGATGPTSSTARSTRRCPTRTARTT